MLEQIKTILARPARISPRMLDPDFVEAVDEMVTTQVRAGYVPLDEIIPMALEYASTPEPSEDQLAYAEQQLAQAICQQVSEQQTWTGPGDYERMQAAFASLEKQGVVCREDYTCCMTCGNAEIRDEIAEMVEQGQAVTGYAFFHQQDTERAVEGGGVHFAYGAIQGGDAAAVEIGQRIASAMTGQGLQVDWNGTINRKVGVALDWKRPLPAEIVDLVQNPNLGRSSVFP